MKKVRGKENPSAARPWKYYRKNEHCSIPNSGIKKIKIKVKTLSHIIRQVVHI